MASIVTSRHEAAALIRTSYPEALQAEALAQLGDAVDVEDAAGLFAKRCDAPCLEAFSQSVAAEASHTQQGEETVVTTVKGNALRLFKGTDTWYGLVWKTEALSRERDRAAGELEIVRENAETFSKRDTLH